MRTLKVDAGLSYPMYPRLLTACLCVSHRNPSCGVSLSLVLGRATDKSATCYSMPLTDYISCRAATNVKFSGSRYETPLY